MASLATIQKPSLSAQFASKYGIDQNKVFAILKDTALKSKESPSDAEVAAFMVVANQYDLNPFIKEIFGFISKGKMQYVISVDGWSTLINRQNQLNGIEFEEHFEADGKTVRSITCKIHRKDRALPTVVTEYFSECRRGDSDVWSKWPVRMLRHKAMIQCSRIAFGLAGVMDEDEAERMTGYVSAPPPVIEASVSESEPDAEVRTYFRALSYTKAKAGQAMRNYSGNREALLEFLRKEADKADIKVSKSTPETIHAVADEERTEQVVEEQGSGESYSEAQPEQTRTTTSKRDNW